MKLLHYNMMCLYHSFACQSIQLLPVMRNVLQLELCRWNKNSVRLVFFVSPFLQCLNQFTLKPTEPSLFKLPATHNRESKESRKHKVFVSIYQRLIKIQAVWIKLWNDVSYFHRARFLRNMRNIIINRGKFNARGWLVLFQVATTSAVTFQATQKTHNFYAMLWDSAIARYVRNSGKSALHPRRVVMDNYRLYKCDILLGKHLQHELAFANHWQHGRSRARCRPYQLRLPNPQFCW